MRGISGTFVLSGKNNHQLVFEAHMGSTYEFDLLFEVEKDLKATLQRIADDIEGIHPQPPGPR